MIAYGDNIQIICGNSNPEFANTICKELGISMSKATVKTFSDGEVSVSLEETVRGADVFLKDNPKERNHTPQGAAPWETGEVNEFLFEKYLVTLERM